jgi:predicted  nucleic acid-binding Zn-ribbon protein
MDDTIQIRCTRCKSTFRDRAKRVRAGYSRECPGCNVLIFFESESTEDNIRRALKAAHRLRRALAAEQDVKPTVREAPAYVRTS